MVEMNKCMPPICQDPASIFLWTDRPQQFRLHGVILPSSGPLNDPSTSTVGIRVENDNGTVYSEELEPGAVAAVDGSTFRLMNMEARQSGGVAFLFIRSSQHRLTKVAIVCYGDFSAATSAHMRTTLTIGDQTFVSEGDWRATVNGWFGGHFDRLHP